MKALLSKINATMDAITAFAATMAAVGLSLIVISYVYEVVTRYFFNAPTAWVSDFVSYALCASVFLALPKVTKDKGHVAVTILVDVMPAKLAGYIHTVISIIGFASLLFAAYVSLLENIRQVEKNIETLAIIPIPQWWVSGFITFGLAMSSIYMLRHAPAKSRSSDNAFVEEAD